MPPPLKGTAAALVEAVEARKARNIADAALTEKAAAAEAAHTPEAEHACDVAANEFVKRATADEFALAALEESFRNADPDGKIQQWVDAHEAAAAHATQGQAAILDRPDPTHPPQPSGSSSKQPQLREREPEPEPEL